MEEVKLRKDIGYFDLNDKEVCLYNSRFGNMIRIDNKNFTDLKNGVKLTSELWSSDKFKSYINILENLGFIDSLEDIEIINDYKYVVEKIVLDLNNISSFKDIEIYLEKILKILKKVKVEEVNFQLTNYGKLSDVYSIVDNISKIFQDQIHTKFFLNVDSYVDINDSLEIKKRNIGIGIKLNEYLKHNISSLLKYNNKLMIVVESEDIDESTVQLINENNLYVLVNGDNFRIDESTNKNKIHRIVNSWTNIEENFKEQLFFNSDKIILRFKYYVSKDCLMVKINNPLLQCDHNILFDNVAIKDKCKICYLNGCCCLDESSDMNCEIIKERINNLVISTYEKIKRRKV